MPQSNQAGEKKGKDKPITVGQTFQSKRLDTPLDKLARQHAGRRSVTRTDRKRGRYIRSRPAGAHPDDIAFIANHPAEFCVGVAAHPEGHPRSPDLTEDRRRLAEKLEDADFAITQFFFGVEPYLRLVDDLAKLGCDRPLVPGVMPFVSAPGLMRMASMNGTHIPSEIGARLETASPEDVARIGVEVASELSRDLIEAGAPGVHLYTLNRSASVRSVWAALGPQSQAPTT